MAGFYAEFDIDHQIDGDMTGLMMAASNGHFDAVKKLIEKNASAQIVDTNGLTASDHAIQNGHQTISTLLAYYQSPKWTQLREFEDYVDQFERDLVDDSTMAIKNLLADPEYKSLSESIYDVRLVENERMWFSFDSRCKIGFNESGSIIWMVDGIRAQHEW